MHKRQEKEKEEEEDSLTYSTLQKSWQGKSKDLQSTDALLEYMFEFELYPMSPFKIH